MKEGLGRRVYREYCWFAVLLVAVLLGAIGEFAFDAELRNHASSAASTETASAVTKHRIE